MSPDARASPVRTAAPLPRVALCVSTTSRESSRLSRDNTSPEPSVLWSSTATTSSDESSGSRTASTRRTLASTTCRSLWTGTMTVRRKALDV